VTTASPAPGQVTVRVPATCANLGPGFDSFGLALSLADTVTARLTSGGVSVRVAGEDTDTAGAGEQHLVVRAMRTAFAAMGVPQPGIAVSCVNEIPQGFGLGSSAAAIVAGLLAARALAGPAALAAPSGPTLPDLAPADLLALATRMEGHPDNVAACLNGGLTIAWTPPGGGPRAARLTPVSGLVPVACVPAMAVPTVTARMVLPPQVPHADAAANSARAALLATALTSAPSLLMDATEDFLHQRYRAQAMPGTAALVAALRAAGIPAVISGAGPSVLAFTRDDTGPSADEVAALAATADGSWRVLPLRADLTGATVTGAAG
jgi:homoserine kinase